MSTKTTDIQQNLIGRINGLGLVQAIYDYRELNPQGWPCVWVLNTDLDGRFVDTANNRRVYAYDVIVGMFSGQDYEGNTTGMPREKYIARTIADTVDAIINDLDDNFTLDGTTVLFVDAADYRVGEITIPQGEVHATQVTLLVSTDYNVM